MFKFCCLFTLVLLLQTSPLRADTRDINMSIEAQPVRPIRLMSKRNLDFGKWVLDHSVSNRYVDIAHDGSISSRGVKRLPSSSVAVAETSIEGEKNHKIVVTFPDEIDLTSKTGKKLVLKIAIDAKEKILPRSGQIVYYFGGNVKIPDGRNVADAYTGEFDVDFNYGN